MANVMIIDDDFKDIAAILEKMLTQINDVQY